MKQRRAERTLIHPADRMHQFKNPRTFSVHFYTKYAVVILFCSAYKTFSPITYYVNKIK